MSPETPQRPNILYVMTDQQNWRMMSCTGNPYLKTPAMDSIAASGVRFDGAYSANAVCVPARIAMMTGHYPGRFGVGLNGHGATNPIPESDLRNCLGWLFSEAGYETAFGGKTHWACNMSVESIGFGEKLTADSYDDLADRAVEFLERDHQQPFLLVTSFHNPHDICLMAIDAYTRAMGEELRYPQMARARENLAAALEIPEGMSREEFFEKHCPPLPENYEVTAGEAPGAAPGSDFRLWARENLSDEDWRLHRWAYCRLTESVDRQIGRVLEALRAAGLEEDTVIVFSSDHGDLDAAHRLEHKDVFYEESSRVPFVVSRKGTTDAGRVDENHLVSANIDLLPTLCDYAGIPVPEGMPGRSVRELAEGRDVADWRDYVTVERGSGRMIRGERYKYCVYDNGDPCEDLFDLREDPGEMKNLAGDAEYAEVLAEHRRQLRAWVDSYGDRIGQAYVPA